MSHPATIQLPADPEPFSLEEVETAMKVVTIWVAECRLKVERLREKVDSEHERAERFVDRYKSIEHYATTLAGKVERLEQANEKMHDLLVNVGREANTECPECEAGLEFSLKIPDLRPAEVTQDREQELFLSADEFSVDYRLPNSMDLAAIAYAHDVASARAVLVSRCVLHACRAETDVVVEELPDAVIEAVAARIMENDPGSHMELDLTCPDCSHRWSMLLDIVSFFWTEIAARGKRLIQEVQSLARTYGWREADILAMSAWRRQLYLEAAS